MTEAWIETFLGIKFDILNPEPEMIEIEDIAHALSQVNRFSGHCKYPYPVSQHCWLGSRFLPEKYALEFLLHDATEAYIGDMNRPLKHFTLAGQEYRKVEAEIDRVIRMKFKLPEVQSEIIHVMDLQMLYAEKERLMSDLQWDASRERTMAGISEEMFSEVKAPVIIERLSFEENKYEFLSRFYELRRKEDEKNTTFARVVTSYN